MLAVRMIVPTSSATREALLPGIACRPTPGRDRCLSDIAFCLQALFFEMLATSDPRDPLLTELGTLTVVHENTPGVVACPRGARGSSVAKAMADRQRALPVYSRFAAGRNRFAKISADH